MARLPVAGALPELSAALEERGAAVLYAPPGTGKTTLMPLALAGLLGAGMEAGERHGGGVRRVLVAEPRRMAARSAARRMAWLLGEEAGEHVGFTVRGERKVSARTRVEVVTTGVLLQRLQRDQELSGCDVVVIDECHERHLDADTAVAFLVDVRATLRPELQLVATSATQDSEAWARLLAYGDDAGPVPVVHGRGTSHPVQVRYSPPPRGLLPPHGTRVDPALLRHVAATVRQALHSVPEGDVLCFLPGVGEITRVAGMLSGAFGGTDGGGGDGEVAAEVLQLHGRAPAAVQEAVLRGTGSDGAEGTGPAVGRRRRVILSTSVAESSLTVPGVRVVVDSGLAREPRTDHARGLGSLTTVRVSHAASAQRLGRAGREAEGVAFRCWAEGEDAARPRWPSPEITVADLTAFALQALCWGDPDASGLALLDAPPAGALAAARDVLRAVGAINASGQVTPRGGRMAGMGLHPRLARALLDGSALVGGELAAEVVALLSEEPPRGYGDDAAEALRAVRRGRDGYADRWRREVRRLRGLGGAADTDHTGGGGGTEGGNGTGGGGSAGERSYTAAVGLVIALAHPERVGHASDASSASGAGGAGSASGDAASYLLATGTRAALAQASPLRGAPWLAVAVADRPAGSASARVRLAAVLDEETARQAAGALRTEREEVRWDEQRAGVVARRVESLGAIQLTERPLASPDPLRVREAVVEGLRRSGLGLLRWTPAAESLRQRMAFLHRELGRPWPDVGDEALLERADEWLGAARTPAEIARLDAGQLLNGLLPWTGGEAARLEALAPERVQVPTGSRIRVDYSGQQPVLAVKLQELFGWRQAPRLAEGRVPLLVHLLSPAGRPAAVTSDLASFWREGYHSVRAELRGRYPRHPWPQDPAAAEPTRRTNARRGTPPR